MSLFRRRIPSHRKEQRKTSVSNKKKKKKKKTVSRFFVSNKNGRFEMRKKNGENGRVAAFPFPSPSPSHFQPATCTPAALQQTFNQHSLTRSNQSVHTRPQREQQQVSATAVQQQRQWGRRLRSLSSRAVALALTVAPRSLSPPLRLLLSLLFLSARDRSHPGRTVR